MPYLLSTNKYKNTSLLESPNRAPIKLPFKIKVMPVKDMMDSASRNGLLLPNLLSHLSLITPMIGWNINAANGLII